MQDVKRVIAKSSEKESAETSNKDRSVYVFMMDIGRERR